MTLRKTRDPNDGFVASNRGGGGRGSRGLRSSQKQSSLRWSFLAGSYSSGASSRGSSSDGGSGGRAGGRSAAGRGGGMAAAAAVVASSYGEGISDVHSLDGPAPDPYAPSSFHHDPSDTSRETVDDAIDASKDAEKVPAKTGGRDDETAVGGGRPCRMSAAVIATAGILLVASVVVGVLALDGDTTNPFASNSGAPGSDTGAHLQAGYSEKHLLELAQRVVSACGETWLDRDMSDCQRLCHRRLCCFEKGEYSCLGDESKNCAVYAGCEALTIGVGGGGDDSNPPSKDEARRVRWG